ncbi:hypothetical protein BDD12DRAFT_258064 [Trichophaea hybrida]|nr:hypothetical protein BDD12DRAFT_258064 [Trichophaea hybrida]
MLTGVEAAGLALAIFPIVVQGVGFYVDGARKVKDLKDHKRVLNRLARDLKVECFCFEEVCARLLEGMVSAGETTLLLKGDGWGDTGFQNRLQERLGPEAAETFTELAEELFSSLQQLKEDLGLGDAKPQSINLWTWNKIKLVISKGDALSEISKTIQQINRLSTCTQRPTSLPKPTRRNPAAKMYSGMRNHAINLYGALSEKFRTHPVCKCSVPHNANLRLEKISADKPNMGQGNPRFSVLFSFDITPGMTHQAPWTWREIEFEPITDTKRIEKGTDQRSDSETDERGESVSTAEGRKEKKGHRRRDAILKPARRIVHVVSSAIRGHSRIPSRVHSPSVQEDNNQSPEKTVSFNIQPLRRASTFDLSLLQEIKDLCSTLANADGQQTKLGILGSSNGWLLRVSNISYCENYWTEAVSLDIVLQQGDLNGPDRGSDRLRLGVQLASSVMQLYSTAWLKESWGKGDIFFPQTTEKARLTTGGMHDILKPVLEKPLVRRSFDPAGDKSPPTTTTRSPFVQYDKSLLSLGIILIELWFATRLQDLPEYLEARQQFNDRTDSTDYETANRLLPKIDCLAGPIYGGAVRRCIRGLDCTATTLDDEGYKNEVQSKVVSELERNWKAFSPHGM